MFNKNQEELVRSARAQLARVPDLMRRLSQLAAPTPAGPLVEEAVRLIAAFERSAHMLHGYGGAYEDLLEQTLWAARRLGELVREELRVTVPPEISRRLEEDAGYLERWLESGQAAPPERA